MSKKFSDVVKKSMNQFKTKVDFYNETGISKMQLGRLLKGVSENPYTVTLSKLSKVTKTSVEVLRDLYNREYFKEQKNEKYDNEIKLNLFKIKSAEEAFDYFSSEQIVEVNFKYEDVNHASSKNIYDTTNYLYLSSKLIKDYWQFSDYYKFLPSSLGDFHRERENEDIAKISFINELQRLINKLEKDNNFIFLNTFEKNFSFHLESSKPIKGWDSSKIYPNWGNSHKIQAEVLKIIISNSTDDYIKINEERFLERKFNNKTKYENFIREVRFKINEKTLIEEELVEYDNVARIEDEYLSSLDDDFLK